jgi:hypothetical protein
MDGEDMHNIFLPFGLFATSRLNTSVESVRPTATAVQKAGSIADRARKIHRREREESQNENVDTDREFSADLEFQPWATNRGLFLGLSTARGRAAARMQMNGGPAIIGPMLGQLAVICP